MESDLNSDLAAGRFHAAFERLVDLYQDKVLRLAYAMLRDETLAQDLAQDAFLKIWKALPSFRQDSSVSTWIYAIVRNTCLTELKKRRDHPLESIEDSETAEQVPYDLEDQNTCGNLDVKDLLEQLPEKYRQVIVLFYLEQRSYEEVSTMLGLPMGTVKTFLYRAKKELLAASRDRHRPLEVKV